MVGGTRIRMDRPRLNQAAATSPLVWHFSGCDVEIVEDAENMRALRDDWDRLSSACPPNIYGTFEWYWGWWTQVARRQPNRRQRLQVLVIRRAGEVVGIVPLALRVVSRGGLTIRKLEFIGGDNLPDYQAPLLACEPELQLSAVADHLAKTRDRWDILELHNLAPAPAEVLHHAFERVFPLQVTRGEDCPFFAVEGPWSSIAQRAGKATRQTLRNQTNRLERHGFRVRIIERPDVAPGLLDRMVSLEARKLVRGASGDQVLARWPEFFSFVFQELGPKGWIGVAVLEKGSELIAYNLFFRCGKSVWDYTKAYDPAYAKLSPGTMLLPAIVDYAHAHGYREYDFLRGSEPYKMKWAASVRRTFHLQGWHMGWRSRLSAVLYFDLHRSAFQVWHASRGAKSARNV
jgi:CelD/BcsL family acetyltransferase involved in cellulose biosynthesis